MAKVKIDKLKYPLWFNITFYLITVLAPVIILVVQGLRSPHVVFRITFTVLSLLVASWLFVKKFILKNIENKITEEKAALEHDYKIDVGSKEKIRWLWFNNEIKLAIFNLIEVVLLGGLIIVLALGIQSAAVSIKGAASLIMILYLLAYSMKFTLIIVLRGKEQENNE